jgi:hypothetical protein
VAHLWLLTGPSPGDPTHLYVYTDDDHLVHELRPIEWRASDAAIKALVVNWSEYVPPGSPEPAKDIDAFRDYIIAAYGTQTYAVVQKW